MNNSVFISHTHLQRKSIIRQSQSPHTYTIANFNRVKHAIKTLSIYNESKSPRETMQHSSIVSEIQSEIEIRLNTNVPNT